LNISDLPLHGENPDLHLSYLQAVVTSLPQGISVFDDKLRLRVWNQGFIDVLGLPPEIVVEGVSFSELIRIPAERGEYGPGDPNDYVQHLTELAMKFQGHRLERTRPNGRTHLTHGEPLLLNGRLAGFISTYTDITERKASEEKLRQQHDLLQTVIDSIPCAVSLFDKNLRLLLRNQEFGKLLDLPEDLLNTEGAGLEHIFRFNAHRGEYGPGDPESIVHALLTRARHPVAHHFQRTRPNGQTLDIRGAPLNDGSFVTIYTDVTERRISAEREQLAQVVFDHTPAGIVVTGDNQRILSINPAAAAMTQNDAQGLIGQHVLTLMVHNDSMQAEQIETALALHNAWKGEVSLRKKNASAFPASLRINRVTGSPDYQGPHDIWIFADITERKEAEARMQHIAQHDSLTGLPNRLSLLIRLGQLLPEARRHHWKIGMMFIDLDRFKVINDTLGHQVGDEMLREVACRLSNVVRETDFVARLGGDEFVILLPGINTPADAAMVAGKIVNALSTPIEAEGHELHTSPSIGISLFPDDGPDGDSILKNADTAMYHAKNAGRNNYQFFTPTMNAAATERLDIERKLRHAISRQEFSLVYQPQFRANRSRPTGVEALIRWHHPTEGMISPDRFIPVAEETGMIVEIGDWVLFQACREMMDWINRGLPPIRVAVNVSARQLRRRDFCETVAGALAESGLPPQYLELEITESSVMENPKEAIEILERLRRMGLSLAIDDFGTGYSSLAYLKLFPIDHLKIDRSFVRDIEYDLNDRAIAFGTIALAHSLGLNVIAEGVETADQLELLCANGCDEVQGYLFSKPLNNEAALAFLLAMRGAQ
jgi:diguanylate cyclase (GGDEF)-like protein/PAS domain S-box-containing protein